MKCERLGWSELAQGGEEAGLIHVGNKHSGFTINCGFFYHNNDYQRINKYFIFSTKTTIVKTLFEYRI
jgi:hypothetical protein